MAFNFSANTGYLWKELPFLDRIRSAKKHGFHSVELHDEAHFEDLAKFGHTSNLGRKTDTACAMDAAGHNCADQWPHMFIVNGAFILRKA